jgi:SAM-dependent methyltransferase
LTTRVVWPLPAFAAWVATWALLFALRGAGVAMPAAIALATLAGASMSLWGGTRWRRIVIGAGFPVSIALAWAMAGLPAWSWLVAAGLLAWLYPRRAWRDAPLFPTPSGALDALAELAPLQAGANVLDAGCGTGDGLNALRRAYPQARIAGTEWSAPLAAIARWRCRFATVRRGDLWADDWSRHDLIYLFQRPDTMARAAEKAQREMRPGGWLVSLEFAVPGRAAHHVIDGPRPVYLYRI